MSTLTTDEIGILIVSLRALANAAPRGPYRVVQSSGYGNASVANSDGPLCATGNSKKRTRSECLAFARYVATIDPDMLSSLLTTLERVTSERDALMAAVDRLVNSFEVSA